MSACDLLTDKSINSKSRKLIGHPRDVCVVSSALCHSGQFVALQFCSQYSHLMLSLSVSLSSFVYPQPSLHFIDFKLSRMCLTSSPGRWLMLNSGLVLYTCTQTRTWTHTHTENCSMGCRLQNLFVLARRTSLFCFSHCKLSIMEVSSFLQNNHFSGDLGNYSDSLKCLCPFLQYHLSSVVSSRQLSITNNSHIITIQIRQSWNDYYIVWF